MNTRAFIAHGHRSAAILAGLVVITAAVASVAPRPVPLPLTDPPIDPRSANKVTSFANDHPEFAPLRDGRKDASGIKFPHAVHFEYPKISAKDWKGVDRRLECLDCHLPEPDGRYMKPVTFEQHCASCHSGSLGRVEVAEGVVPSAQTPHGDEAAIGTVVDAQVYQWIASGAIKPATGTASPAEEPKPSGGGRRGRGGAGAEVPKKAAAPELKSPEELSSFLVAKRDEVFKDLAKGTKCGYCHTVEKADTKGSPFVVKNPHIPDQWLPRSIFSHAAHMMVSCTSCHDVEKSSSTSDINLPDIASCRECHSPRSASLASAGIGSVGANGAGDSCVMCHVYHPKGGAPMEGKLKPKDLLRD